MAYRGSRVRDQGLVIGHEFLEEQNEQKERNLKEKVSQLKDITIKIQMEVMDQRPLLNNMEDRFNNISSTIANTIGKVGRLMKSRSNEHIHYLLLFCLFVFLVIWFYL